MFRPSWVVGVCLLFGVAGLIQHWQKARGAGAIPNACYQFECKNVSVIWNAKPKNSVLGFVDAGGNNVTVQGIANLFTVTSTFQAPANKLTGQQVDIVAFPACSPMCGKDPN